MHRREDTLGLVKAVFYLFGRQCRAAGLVNGDQSLLLLADNKLLTTKRRVEMVVV